MDQATLGQVSGRVIGIMTLAAREDGTAFADVVYADQDWVDEEFAELVAASLGGPPAAPPPAPPRVPPRRGRQRSPPARPRAARPARSSR
jgi:hypothetical protein